MFAWFDTSEIADYAKAFVHEVSVVFPPMQPPKTEKKARDKMAKNLEAAFLRAAQFGKDRKLNWYKKARYLNAIRWGLKDLGYPDDIIDTMVKEILFRI